MALTGKTAIAISPAQGRRARVFSAPEASSQSGAKGQPAVFSGGYVSYITGNITGLNGFARVAPQNGASDGAKTASLYLAENDAPYKATYLGTLSESIHGLRANLSVDSAGAQWLKYDTNSSNTAIARIIGWDRTQYTAGDVNPEVTFVLLQSAVLNGV